VLTSYRFAPDVDRTQVADQAVRATWRSAAETTTLRRWRPVGDRRGPSGHGTTTRTRTIEPTITQPPGRWTVDAACRRATGTALAAYTADGETIGDAAALAACATCPALTACDAYARTARIVCGIWGGRRRQLSDARGERAAA